MFKLLKRLFQRKHNPNEDLPDTYIRIYHVAGITDGIGTSTYEIKKGGLNKFISTPTEFKIVASKGGLNHTTTYGIRVIKKIEYVEYGKLQWYFVNVKGVLTRVK